MDLRLYTPEREDGWFYVKMMSDPETMAYNAPWFPPDGCIPNPEEEWETMMSSWVGCEDKRFYAFLQRISDGSFVGDVNYHYSNDFETNREAAYRVHRAVGFKELGIENGNYLLEITREDYFHGAGFD